MANKIGILLALDGEAKFAQGMKNAATSAKQLQTGLTDLKDEYKGSANSLEYLSQRQKGLEASQRALNSVVDAAKAGQKNAQKNFKATSEALEDLKKKLDEAKTALSKMDASDAGYAKQAREVEKLASAVDKQALQVQKADGNVTRWDAKLQHAESDVRKNSRAVSENQKYLAEASQSADKCATSIDKFGNAAKAAGDKSESFGSKLKDGIITGLGINIANVGADAVNALKEGAQKVVEVGSNFEASMSKVKALSGASGADFDSLSEKAQELGRNTKFSASEAADAMANMALAGWGTQQTLSGIDGVLDLAAAGEMDLATAADTVAGNLAAFNMSASESSKLADIMATAQARSKTNLAQLAEAYSTSATNMTQYGQSVTTTTALLEGMASVNDTGSAAGTKLSAVMAQITQKMKDGAIQIGNTSVKVQDSQGNFRDLIDIMDDVAGATAGMGDAEKAAALGATFNRTSLSAVNEILAVGADKLREYQVQLESSDGAAANMAGTMQDNLKGAVTEFQSAAEGLGVALYDDVKTPLTGVVDLATTAVNGITDAIKGPTNALTQFADAARDANDNVRDMMDSSQDSLAGIEGQVWQLGQYKAIIDETQSILANGGTLNDLQLAQVSDAVGKLSEQMPALGAAFDGATGKINLQKEAVDQLFASQQNLIVQNALQAAGENAQTALINAQVSVEQLKQAGEEAKKTIADLSEDVWHGDPTKEQRESYQAAQKVLSTYDKDLQKAEKTAADAQKNYDSVAKAATEVAKQYSNASESAGGVDTTLSDLADEFESANDSARDTSGTLSGLGDDFSDLGGAVEDATQKLQEFSDADAAIMKNDRSEAVKSAWQKMVDDAANSLSSTSITEKINEIDETTTEQWLEAAQHNAEALKNYNENLDILKDLHTRNVISDETYEKMLGFSPEQLAHLGNTITKQGQETLDQEMAKYSAAVDQMADEEAAAAKQTAIEKLSLNGFDLDVGSPDVDFTELRAAIDSGITGASESATAQVSALVDVCQEMGVKIPDGLADGISGQTINAETAIAELTAAISGQVDGLSEIMSDSGTSVSSNLITSLQQGLASGDTGQILAAYQGIIQQLSSTDIDVSPAGKAIADTTAAGVTDNADTVKTAAETSVTEANARAERTAQDMKKAGTQAGISFADGLAGAASDAAAAASVMVQAAIRSASNGTSQAHSVGYNLSSGIASGISSGASIVAIAAAAVVNRAISSAKAAGVIKSPSRKMRDEVGQWLSKGVASGITAYIPASTSAASALVNQTVAAAQSALTHANAASVSGLYDGIASNFGVLSYTEKSTTKTTGKGKKKKTRKITTREAKSADDYYNEIERAAENHLSNIQSLQDVSAQQQLDYWRKVSARLKRGTDAWYNAAEKIRKLEQEIGSIGAANSLLDNLRDYSDLSEKAVVQYWERIKKQYVVGSDNWIEADKKLLEAKRKYEEKLTDIQEDYAEKRQDILDKEADAIASRADEIAGAFGLFDVFESKSDNGATLLFNMQSQAAGVQDWRDQLDALTGRGILSQDLIDAITAMGPDQDAAIHALNDLTDDQLRQYQQAYDTKMSAAMAQAKEDTKAEIAELEAQRKALEQSTAAEIASVNASLSAGAATLADNIHNYTKEQTASLVAAMQYNIRIPQSAPTSVPALTSSGAASAAAPAAAKQDPIRAAIDTGKSHPGRLTNREKKSHVALWEYLVSKYHRAPSTTTYKKLAAALGIKVGKTVSNKEKNKILRALKKRGYASGTQSALNEIAWTQERGNEMIVRKSDGAVLTRLNAGDMVAPADLTKNLWKWGGIDPSELPAMISGAVLNAELTYGYRQMQARDASGQQVLAMLARYLPEIAAGRSVYLDGKTLVGGIMGDISRGLANRARRA